MNTVLHRDSDFRVRDVRLEAHRPAPPAKASESWLCHSTTLFFIATRCARAAHGPPVLIYRAQIIQESAKRKETASR